MTTTANIGQPPVLTIPQFCSTHHISRTHFYELQKAGKAPRLMKPGRRVLITAEAAADWRRDMERATDQREI